MVELKNGMTEDEILNTDNEEIRSCNFSIDTIREETKDELIKQNKDWNNMQIDILVQGVENSDWLKIKFDYVELRGEIRDWIEMLEEEWKNSGEFGYE